MKRTRKWAFVAQEATRLHALGLKPSEIAEKLGVNKSTVTRWIAHGKLERRPEEASEKRAVLLEWKEKTAAHWAAAVRREYDLSETDEQLVALAERALALSRDPHAKDTVVLMAMGRFQTLTRQLALDTRRGEQPELTPAPPPIEKPKPAAVRVPRADPRSLFMVN